MKKGIFGCILFLMVSVVVNAQLPENSMSWQEDLLEWSDFRGKPQLHNSFHANTTSGISYSWSLKTSEEGKEFVFSVESYFFPEGSWVKPGKTSENLLAHEQLHFDITELHARKLRSQLQEFNPEKVKDIKKALREIYQKIEAERAHMQQKFDVETRHSQNAEAQLKWQEVVRLELGKYEEFSS